MAIWMDMTNSMHTWDGGVVGIVRAELEIAKNMKKENEELRFFKYNGQSFEEIDDSELSWLWECTSVGDAYMTAMGRSQDDSASRNSDANKPVSLINRYPGLANAYNYSSSRLFRLVWGLCLYANSFPQPFRSITKKIITTLSWPLRFLSLKRAQRRERKAKVAARGNTVVTTCVNETKHPFKSGDTIFSCGWMYSGKESGFETIKDEIPDISIIYLVYDIIIIRDKTKQFYAEYLQADFGKYINWISFHCNAVLCGGKTAVADLGEFQKKHCLPVTPAYPVYFGSSVIKEVTDAENAEKHLRELGVKDRFILAVGTYEERKNYTTLYRAMTILAERDKENCPQLIIVGRSYNTMADQIDTIKRDPEVEGIILMISPTDEELGWLYNNSLFVVLASAWEGWSLTLPEALQYGKLVLASDVAPLREAAQDYAVYLDPFDPFAWANKIDYYCRNRRIVKQHEKNVKANYHAYTWADCGKQINEYLIRLNSIETQPTAAIYFDVSLSWFTALYGGKITGILRTELMLAKKMYQRNNRIKFFAIDDVFGYVPLDLSVIEPIIIGEHLDMDFEVFCNNMRQIHYKQLEHYTSPTLETQVNEELRSKEDSFWFLVSVLPANKQEKWIEYGKRKKKQLLSDNAPVTKEVTDDQEEKQIYDVPFSEGDVVFNAGTGSGVKTYEKLLRTKKAKKYLYCPIIYDFTPLLMPQVHQQETIDHYVPFIEFTSKMADLILYGGETARQDGIAYQKKMGLPQPRSCAIKFGSDISSKNEKTEDDEIDGKDKADNEKKILKQMGVRGPFIMAVGTMEVRKNHETLYRAYLRMLEEYEDIPQMVFAGHPGWKTADFLATFSRDERVRGKILQLSPTDEQLDILYRHCEFTVLASMYEGWSLTLPESYWYGKFCLCCDTPALKETAGDLAEYIHRWDEKKWAERIEYYHTHPAELAKREDVIAKNWHTISWEECAGQVLEILNGEIERSGKSEKGKSVKTYEQTH